MTRRQTYVFWNADALRQFKLSRRRYRKIAKSPDYITPKVQWDADLAAHGAYLVTLPHPDGGPPFTWQVTRPAAQWAATTQTSFQFRRAA